MDNDRSQSVTADAPRRCPKLPSNIYTYMDDVIHDMQGILVYLKYGNLYIVDIRDIPRYCSVCGYRCPNEVRLYCGLERNDIFGSYDGIIRLPTKIFELNLRGYIIMDHFWFPDFGAILVVGNCIMYNPRKKIDKMRSASVSSSTFMIDGEFTVPCSTRDNRLVLVNMDGKIIDMETTYYTNCESNITVNTPYGDFSAIKFCGEYYYRKWTFTKIVPAPKNMGLRTKPASREIDYS